MENEKKSINAHRKNRHHMNLIAFLGGKTTLFVLVAILLIGLIIFTYNKIPFVFYPLSVLFSTVVLPIILAMIAYYLLRPILRLLEKVHIPRGWGILIIFLGAAGLLTLLIFLVLPFLKYQFNNLVEEFPSYFRQLAFSTDEFLRSSIFSSLYSSLDVSPEKLLDSIPSDIGSKMAEAAGGIASGITSFVGALTGFVLSIVTVPFILFYLLKDGEKLPNMLIKMLPPRMRPSAREIVVQADHQISSYIQGQILVAICIGIMV